MTIAVLGAGAWGTSVAVQLARRAAVHLWARHAEDARVMQSTHINARYLPHMRLPDSLQVHAGTATASDVAMCDLVLVVCPVAGLREQLGLLHGAR